MKKYNSTQLLLLGLYRYCKTQEIVSQRVRAILSSAPSAPQEIEGYEPFAGESPCVPPLGSED